MKEYKVRICEIRYEYINANSPREAVGKAARMAITDADEIKCEIVDDDEFEAIRPLGRESWSASTTGLAEQWTGNDICCGDGE